MRSRELVRKLNSCSDEEIDEIVKAEPQLTLTVIGWLRKDRRKLVASKLSEVIQGKVSPP